jgi:HAD superfamily hydrolase (TIGR01509 family)
MADAAIFDIDGTLLDSVDFHAMAWQEAFRHFGHDLEYASIRSLIGRGGDQILPLFLSPEEREKTGKAIQELRSEIFKSKYLNKVKPFPRVRDLFLKLRSDGVRVAIASSAKADELEQFEKIAGVDDLTATETSSADAERSKPHPDIFEAALDRLGNLNRSQVIVVGDTPHDAEAAGKAGLKTVGVLCGGFAEGDLRRAGCIAIYKDPADLLAGYDESPLKRGNRAA